MVNIASVSSGSSFSAGNTAAAALKGARASAAGTKTVFSWFYGSFGVYGSGPACGLRERLPVQNDLPFQRTRDYFLTSAAACLMRLGGSR